MHLSHEDGKNPLRKRSKIKEKFYLIIPIIYNNFFYKHTISHVFYVF